MESFKIFIFLALFVGLAKASTPSDDHYYAAVVEFAPKLDGNARENFLHNLNGYETLLKNNLKTDDQVDIVIFPEASLNLIATNLTVLTFVPEPADRKILCDNSKQTQDFLAQLSCWAQLYKKYMVFNIGEKVNCTDKSHCTSDGLNKYNTNVIFDRNGTLIARYRKHNLYVEPGMNSTTTAELVTFETDFGVKFGTFICFDVLFWEPTMKLIEMGIKDFIYPTYWYSELPFLTANQVQFQWAYANDVNFLVSGGSHVSSGNTGTGVFSGKLGALRAQMYNTTTSEMLIVKVPKKNGKVQSPVNNTIPSPSPIPERITGIYLKRDEIIDLATASDINSSAVSLNQKICHKDFCCTFRINTTAFTTLSSEKISETYSFKMLAYAGNRSYDGLRSDWCKFCAIVSCTDSKNISTCGTIFSENTSVQNYHYFDSIEIEGDFEKTEKMLILPSTLDQRISVLSVNQFDFNITENGNNNAYHVLMKLKKPSSDLLTFAIYTSYYDSLKSGQGALKISFVAMTFSIIISKIFRY